MEVKYLGVIITSNGVHMDPTKIEAILNWPPLWNVKEVQLFLEGHPLELGQQVPKHIPPPEEGLHLHSSPPPFQPSLPIILKCNASDYTITGILFQSDFRGKDLHPIAFYTCSIIPAELNYNIYDKELLAIVKAFYQWQAYRKESPHHIQVYSNHNNLQLFMTMKQLSHCQAQWSKTLSEYDFTIHYCSSQLGAKPDALIWRISLPMSPTKLPKTSDLFTSSSKMRLTLPIKPTPSMPTPNAAQSLTNPLASCPVGRKTEDEKERTHKAPPAILRPPHWQATPPTSVPSPPLPWAPLHLTPPPKPPTPLLPPVPLTASNELAPPGVGPAAL
ncbi:hypothetical protein E4T56_gene8311 [Termitomyces sp. T112]|nr:hypothetical protein E4T56_gene8311 [Termitomyces sp. T112]